jgi:hypothetical protein
MTLAIFEQHHLTIEICVSNKNMKGACDQLDALLYRKQKINKISHKICKKKTFRFLTINIVKGKKYSDMPLFNHMTKNFLNYKVNFAIFIIILFNVQKKITEKITKTILS